MRCDAMRCELFVAGRGVFGAGSRASAGGVPSGSDGQGAAAGSSVGEVGPRRLAGPAAPSVAAAGSDVGGVGPGRLAGREAPFAEAPYVHPLNAPRIIRTYTHRIHIFEIGTKRNNPRRIWIAMLSPGKSTAMPFSIGMK